jgi:peptidylglycine monooxygenase
LCTPFKLDQDATQFITAFEPKADKATAHHMLLFGCKTPGKRDPIFNCGAMAAKQRGLSSSINPCGLGTAVLYAWAQNAPKLHLPKDVAFRVGGPDSGIDWLVLQVNPLLLLVTSYKGKVPFSKTFYRKIIYCW